MHHSIAKVEAETAGNTLLDVDAEVSANTLTNWLAEVRREKIGA